MLRIIVVNRLTYGFLFTTILVLLNQTFDVSGYLIDNYS